MSAPLVVTCSLCGGTGLVPVGITSILCPCDCQDPGDPTSRHHKPHDCAVCEGAGKTAAGARCRTCGGCGRVAVQPEDERFLPPIRGSGK